MFFKRKLTTKDVALVVCFSSLYTVLSFLPLSQVIGLLGKYITGATVIAPIIGIIVEVNVGVLSTVLGGIIGLFFSPYFSQPSFIAGIVTSLCANLLYTGKRGLCILIYVTFLFIFSFYPYIGPFWLYRPFLWFQIIGLIILISPLQSRAVKSLKSGDHSIFLALFITSLTTTLAGQIAGSITFEFISWPILISDMNFYTAFWQGLTFLYPLERTIIAFASAFIGTALNRVLKSTNLKQSLNYLNQKEKCP